LLCFSSNNADVDAVAVVHWSVLVNNLVNQRQF